jgi:protease-4
MEKTFGREVAGVFLRVFAVILTFIFILGITDAWYQAETVSDGSCNIAVLPIEGAIMPFSGYDDFSLVTTPSTVRDFIDRSEKDPFIEGLLLEINSPGGTPVASEQISQIIRNTHLTSIALIGDIGASGGYLVSAGADKIIASAMSDVGSIGVTMSYTENSKKNEEEGVTFVELSSGKFKDSGNPEKPLTEEERDLFKGDLEIIHKEFVRQVAELRGKSVEEIQALADGSAMPGSRALEKGLIDMIGNRQTAKQEFAKTLGLNEDEIVFCEYSAGLLPF